MRRLLVCALVLAMLSGCRPTTSDRRAAFDRNCDKHGGVVEQLRDARGNAINGRVCLKDGKVIDTE